MLDGAAVDEEPIKQSEALVEDPEAKVEAVPNKVVEKLTRLSRS